MTALVSVPGAVNNDAGADADAFVQTLHGWEKNIRNIDAAQGGLFEARFDNELLANDSTIGADVAAMIKGHQTHYTTLVTAAAEGFHANAADVSGNNVPHRGRYGTAVADAAPDPASGAGNAVAHAAAFGTDNPCDHQHQHFEYMWG
jgi:hypothetical protein